LEEQYDYDDELDDIFEEDTSPDIPKRKVKELPIITNQQEIRINPTYTSFLLSDYPEGDLRKGSIPKKRLRVVPSSKYFERMLSKINTAKKSPEILPMYCRYKEILRDYVIYVLEEPPAFRTICLDIDLHPEIEQLKKNGKLEEYGYENFLKENSYPYMINLAIPFSIFIMIVSPGENRVLDAAFFFRTQPLTGKADYLLKAPFLNISDTQYVCFGDRVGNSERSEIAAVDNARSSWWSTKFNTDYVYNYNEYQNTPGVSNFLTWQYMSQKDPMFVYHVDWIKHSRNLSEEIACIGERSGSRSIYFGYDNMFRLFDDPVPAGISKKLDEGYFREVYYDVSNGFMVGRHRLNVGDSFKYKGDELAFITSFAGYSGGAVNLVLLTYKEKEFLFKITSKSQAFLKEKIIEQRYIPEVVTPSGLSIKANMIISKKGPYGSLIYKKVGYIRPALDGKIEVSIGGDYYLLDNLTEKYEALDMSAPKYYDIELKEGETYMFDRTMSGRTRTFSEVKYEGVEVTRNGSLIFQFQDQNRSLGSGLITLDVSTPNLSGCPVFTKSELSPLPKVFASGRKIQMVKDRNSGNIVQASKRSGNIYLVPNTRLISATLSMVEQECLNDDTLKISSDSLDISFKIGDKVVAADMENPINTLNVKVITGFNVDRNEGTISFVLMDKQEKLHMVPYIRCGSNSQAFVGRIRKITNLFNDVSSGSKIVAKVAGIPVFPKKDANIIIGFITDTGGDDPLVLCSNGCTLWFSEMIEKFDIIPMKDIRWKALQHAPLDVSKIKLQPGDIVNGAQFYKNNYGYLVSRNQDNRGLRALYLDYFASSEYVTVDSYFSKDVVFDSIPNPRVSASSQATIGVTQAIPNFHGLYHNSETRMCMLNEPRRIINNV